MNTFYFSRIYLVTLLGSLFFGPLPTFSEIHNAFHRESPLVQIPNPRTLTASRLRTAEGQRGKEATDEMGRRPLLIATYMRRGLGGTSRSDA